MNSILKISILSFSLAVCTALKAQNWFKVNSNTLETIEDMYFKDEMNGYAIARNTVLHTNDGGENWNILIQDTSLVHDLSVVTTNDSVFCFGTDFWGSHVELAFLQNTTNYIKRTIPIQKQDPVFFNYEIWDVNSANSSLQASIQSGGVSSINVVNNFISGSHSSYIVYSSDQGQTWQQKFFWPPNALSSFPYQSYFNGSDTLLCVTNYPTILHYSFDNGLNWDTIHTQAIFYHFFDAKNIVGLFVYGQDNKIYSSTNGGVSFSIDSISDDVNKSYFYDRNLGFIFGDSGVIYKTTNGGGTVGINAIEQLKKKVIVFPNPSNESIKVEKSYHTEIKSIKLFDLKGNLIKIFATSETILKIIDIAKGQYLLSIETNYGIFTEKIIKE
jgi:photosystem II stability/assembly factor-like uncharacterized protein